MGWLARETGRLFHKRSNDLDTVQPGSTFQMVHDDNMIETAEVISVRTDIHGIPHVRYHVSFRRPHRTVFDGGARMLALTAFTERYEPVAGEVGEVPVPA